MVFTNFPGTSFLFHAALLTSSGCQYYAGTLGIALFTYYLCSYFAYFGGPSCSSPSHCSRGQTFSWNPWHDSHYLDDTFCSHHASCADDGYEFCTFLGSGI